MWVVVFNLKKYIDIETIHLLESLRKALNTDQKKKIHYYLLPEDDKKHLVLPEIDKRLSPEEKVIVNSNIELYDYLGTLELGAIMLHRKAITLNEFNNQFGYRVNNIMNNKDVRAHIYSPDNDYSYLIWAICLMKSMGLINTNNQESEKHNHK